MKAMPASAWRDGNRVRLIENGEEFFARTFSAIDQAQREILLETFIWFEDKVGLDLQRHLIDAAQRGVRVDVTVDGFGSPKFTPKFIHALTSAGVRFRVFDPHRPLLGMRLHVFRRMHRKLLVVDGTYAFVGGINFSADHLQDFGPEAKQDYAVELEGPVTEDIHSFLRTTLDTDGIGASWRRPQRPRRDAAVAGNARVLFIVRDNDRHTNTIEDEYRAAIRVARREVIIANAYFFPSYGFLRELRHAARRGVQVSLIFQGEPDMPIVLTAARTLYRHLLDEGVQIHEYCERPFHGKVALVDDDWSTVGSSNLDPLSLSLNLEANVFIRDAAFTRHLRERLVELKQLHCRPVDPAQVPQRTLGQTLSNPLVFHCARRFPAWAGLLPAHTPRTILVRPPPNADESAQ